MKKDIFRCVISLAVVLVLYLLVVFLIPFVQTPTFWISFVFTLASFGIAAAAICIAFLRSEETKSRFYGFPIARIGLIYGGAQLVVGLVCMALGCWIPWWTAVLVYALGMGAAILGLISTEAVVDHIQSQDAQQKKVVTVLRGLQSKVNLMALTCSEPALKQLAEELRFADPVSSEALVEIEVELAGAVDALQEAVVDGDTEAILSQCNRATTLLHERNRQCKLNK